MTTRAYPLGATPESPVARTSERAREADQPVASDRGRRILNILVAFFAIVIMVPVMALIAIAVKLSSPGPVKYTQTRIGLDRRRRGSGTNTGTRRRDLGGQPFRIFKFRTMRVQAQETERWAAAGDTRITSVGKVLRQYRVDELPQLFNVLRGDMNVVGPRPEQPAIFARLRGRINRYSRRQLVRPGITGWAQVNLAYDQTEDDARRKLQYDLEYIGKQSAVEDLRIMARTVPVMLGKKGAQ
jgi:lipopolysaccharide/colanic/teichoic acid biosynthesis glycosyltransferase